MSGSISWEWNTLQCNTIDRMLTDKLQHFYFESCKTHHASLVYIPYTLTHAAKDTVIAVAKVVEPIIKGLGNIFGCLFHKDCSLLQGLTFIIVQTPCHLVEAAKLPLTLICHAIRLVTMPIYLVLNQINKQHT